MSSLKCLGQHAPDCLGHELVAGGGKVNRVDRGARGGEDSQEHSLRDQEGRRAAGPAGSRASPYRLQNGGNGSSSITIVWVP